MNRNNNSQLNVKITKHSYEKISISPLCGKKFHRPRKSRKLAPKIPKTQESVKNEKYQSEPYSQAKPQKNEAFFRKNQYQLFVYQKFPQTQKIRKNAAPFRVTGSAYLQAQGAMPRKARCGSG